MAHPAQVEFVRTVRQRFPSYFTGGRVLEVGSLNVNGTVRDYFRAPEEYVGIDLGPGPGVDVVCPGHRYDSAEPFDVAVSCEAFEHDPLWPLTFGNMVRLTRPGGLVLVTCAHAGRPEHGTAAREPESSPFTHGHYRNLTPGDFYAKLPVIWTRFADYGFEVNGLAKDLYFWGVRGAA